MDKSRQEDLSENSKHLNNIECNDSAVEAANNDYCNGSFSDLTGNLMVPP